MMTEAAFREKGQKSSTVLESGRTRSVSGRPERYQFRFRPEGLSQPRRQRAQLRDRSWA
jgi:hypothetical protein